MRTGFIRIAIVLTFIMALVLPGYAGQLDDYYLSAFGQQPGSVLEKAVLLQVANTDTPHSGTPLRHALSRDWKKLDTATQKVLAKQLSAPVLSGTPTSLLSSGGHFAIHYTTSGADAPDTTTINRYTGLSLTSATDWAAKVGDAFEAAYSFYLGANGLGYHPPANFPGAPLNVYLVDLASQGAYGFTQDDQPAPSAGYPYAYIAYIQLDKDFTNGIFRPATYTPLQSLQITSAHEFHHTIQYGYNYYFDIWYAEVTSTWFEGEVYPTITQNYDYISGWFNNSTRQINLAQSDPTFNSQAYGRWIFNRYLAEKHTTTVVRSIWEKLAGIAPTNGQDIPMVPVIDSVLSSAAYNSSLGTDFLGFAKRVYVRDWPTTTTITTTDIGLIAPYSPIATYSSYPVNSSTATPSVTLPHYSFAYYKFIPSTATTSLTISMVNDSGIQTAVFKKAGGTISEIVANTGGSYTVSGFNTLNPATDEVALLIANTTNVDNQQANFSTDGTTPSVTTSTSTGNSSSSGSGCFIATAAYGSYLHPQVQALRDFRDKYLLTNVPGRTFVALYYHMSPPVADFISRNETLRVLVRFLLTPIIFSVSNPWIVYLIAGSILWGGCLLYIRRRTISISRRIQL